MVSLVVSIELDPACHSDHLRLLSGGFSPLMWLQLCLIPELFFFSFLFFAPAAFLAPAVPGTRPVCWESRQSLAAACFEWAQEDTASSQQEAASDERTLASFSCLWRCWDLDSFLHLSDVFSPRHWARVNVIHMYAPLASASPLLLANLPLPWLDTLVEPALRDHQTGSGIQLFIPKYMPTLPSSVCLCVSMCACLQKLQERRK